MGILAGVELSKHPKPIYAIPRIEAALDDTRSSKAALIKQLRAEMSCLRYELRSYGFDVPLAYGGVDKARVVALRAQGCTLHTIGEKMGISGARVWQIIKQMNERDSYTKRYGA